MYNQCGQLKETLLSTIIHKSIMRIIRKIWIGIIIFIILLAALIFVVNALQHFASGPAKFDVDMSIGAIAIGFLLSLLKLLAVLLIGVISIVLAPLLYLLQYLFPYWQIIAFLVLALLVADLSMLYFEKLAKIKERKYKLAIIEEQKKIEAEVERRKNIVFHVLQNLYKETEKEVNKTLIPTLIHELWAIYSGFHSENMNDLIINGSLTVFQDIINSMISELNRLKQLALEAQKKGYTEEGYTEDFQSEENNGEITKEKALKILGLKQDATKEDVKKAYKTLVWKYNIDQREYLEDHIKELLTEKMKNLNSAREHLQNLGFYD